MGFPNCKTVQTVKSELTSTTHGVILRGTRIVIPAALQQRAIDIAHETHLGIEKTKSLIREKIWFPQIDNQVKNTIVKCTTCQAVGQANPPEPLRTTEMPELPWRTVHIDFYGPLPSSEYLLVAVDRYSRFPEVEIVHSTRASTVIPKLDKMFSVHGIPDTLISDNGPPFNGDDYARYLKALGIQAKFSTPYWPQGNATVERFMRPLGKALKTATLEGRPWKQELNRFLLQYRATPHCTTGVPPSELLFNRVIKGKLPVINSKKIVNRHKEARDNEKTRQERNREYANQRRNTRKSDLQVGDYVLRINKPREEDTDDEGFDYEENSQNNQPSISNENNVAPRSSRIRRLPNRYGHEYPSNLIN
ncbi:PREDICTED: uncharacterized protein K02A2.6-like [Paramuricea clavata]|uniref:PREDICTED: uncharacterized protein K02A2.6-like n=2 Tax=Paramuricea clavata TaxID=317549 RepID=A0A7D9J5Z0_PARCT|nr:PREDICTED: uncharacterized protein K02A2.6-like [Paramuricea clavata]